MKILVTGSLGTVGTPLVQKLKGNGHQVWECDLVHSDRQNYKRVDIREYRQVQQLFSDHSFDVVYHLAAEFGRLNGENYYENLWVTNVIGTRHILEMQKVHNFKLIFSSSSEIYGNTNAEFMYEDIYDTLPIEHHNDYSITKYVNEKQIKRFGKLYGTTYTVFRFFNTYGPGEYFHPFRSVVCLFCYNAIHGLPINVYKGGYRDFMYIDDLVGCIAGVIDLDPKLSHNETFNVGSHDNRSVEELCSLVFQTLGKPETNVTYHDGEYNNVKVKRPDISKAVKILNYDPKVNLEEGLKHTIDWMFGVYRGN